LSGSFYRSVLKGQETLDFLTIEDVGPVDCPETSVQNYHLALRNIAEERISHPHRGGMLKSRIILRISDLTAIIFPQDSFFPVTYNKKGCVFLVEYV
jgi:hypothetical protein